MDNFRRTTSQLKYEYKYGNQGELSSITDNINQVTTNFLYDLSGRLVKSTDTKGNKWVFGFDNHSNMNSIDKTQFGVIEKESITFDLDKKVKNFKLYQGTSLKLDQTIEYDTIGRIKSIGTSGQIPNPDPMGIPFILGNILSKSYLYKPGEVAGSTTTLVSKETIGSLVKDYTYDLKGNIDTITVGNKVIDYDYDLIGQLTKELVKVAGVETSKIEYDYDTGGNIQTKTVTTDGVWCVENCPLKN